MEKRKTIPVLLAALLVSAAARADLMPIREPATDPAGRASILHNPDLPREEASWPLAGLLAADSDARSGGVLPEKPTRIEPDASTPHLHVLTDRHSGVGLCLCAFVGLGLGKVARHVKRFPLGAIPEWYHDGGPYQIGHSLAIAPDCRGPAPACFAPPKENGAGSPRSYRDEIVVPLRPQSQSVFTLFAPRGPPPRLSQMRR